MTGQFVTPLLASGGPLGKLQRFSGVISRVPRMGLPKADPDLSASQRAIAL